MAYSAITDGEIDTDSALTTTLMRKYRDNLEAIRSGDQTAPRVESNGMSFTRSIQRAVSSDAGGNPLLNIGLGDSRQQLIRLDVSWSVYGVSLAGVADGDFSITGFGDHYRAGGTGLITGDSTVYLQGSDDLSNWTDLQLVGSYDFSAAGGGDTADVVAKSTVIWDGRGVSGKYAAAAYRYFRVYADGDSDHLIEGDFYLMAMGD